VAQHISRKELKKDEVRETFAHGAEAVLSHQQLTIYLLGAAIVVALAIFGWRTYSERQTVKASAELNEAMKVFLSRVRTPGEPSDAGEVTYVDEKNKFTDASQKFGSLAMKYPRTRPGQIASYYAALSLEKIGKDEDARKWLQGLSESSSEDLAAMARFELAQLDDRAGRGDEAVKIYEQLIAKPAALVPKAVVMMALAEHYAAKNPAEAAKLFTQIKNEYPDTPIAEQADQELALLPGKI
jgi:predicted negative regulator of RcsB-dependent stress response